MTHLRPIQQQAIEAIVARAEVDPPFRAALLRDPARAVSDAFGVSLPPGFRIRFIERAPTDDLLVVLTDPVGNAGELSDDQLDAVAGGAGTTGLWAETIVDQGST
jgi:hypothetical protein